MENSVNFTFDHTINSCDRLFVEACIKKLIDYVNKAYTFEDFPKRSCRVEIHTESSEFRFNNVDEFLENCPYDLLIKSFTLSVFIADEHIFFSTHIDTWLSITSDNLIQAQKNREALKSIFEHFFDSCQHTEEGFYSGPSSNKCIEGKDPLLVAITTYQNDSLPIEMTTSSKEREYQAASDTKKQLNQFWMSLIIGIVTAVIGFILGKIS